MGWVIQKGYLELDAPPHVCSVLLITGTALSAFFSHRNYIHGILQACDMTSRCLCFACLQEWLLPECACTCCRRAWLSCGPFLATSVLCVTLRHVHIYCNLTLLLRACYLLRQKLFFFDKVVLAQLGKKIRRFLWNPRTHYRVYGAAAYPSSESFVRHCFLFRVISPSLNPVLSHQFSPPVVPFLSHHSALDPSSESSLS